MKRTAVAVVCLVLLFAAGPLVAADISISTILPRLEVRPDSVSIELAAPLPGESYYLYYRTKGSKPYQVRLMRPDSQGRPLYRISLKNLYGRELEYFVLSSRGKSRGVLSPVFSVADLNTGATPRVYFQQDGAAPGQEAVKKDPLLRMTASMSTNTRLHDENEPAAKPFTANGNVRFYRNIVKDKYQFDFDSNFSYMSQVTDTESHVNLSSMVVRYKRGNLNLEAGDLSINNTELTTSYLNRRGISASMENKWLHVSSFMTNSQQKTGFDGFGVPPANAMLIGALLGVQKSNLFKVRGLFLTGKDNLDSKTVYYSEDLVREGYLTSLSGELNLLKSRMQLLAEYAHSSFGKAATADELEKQAGEAYTAGARLNAGILSLSADYKSIDNNYNSIANLFLQNDREGWNSNLGLNIKTFSVSIGYNDQKTYVNSPIQPMLRTKNLNSNFSWLIANHIRIGAEYGVDNLDYDQSTGLQTGGTDMDTLRYAATLGLVAGANGITLRVGKTESKTFTSNLDASLSLNLSLGRFLTFNPTLSYQNSDNLSDGSTSKMYNLYLSSELTFIPQVFSLSINGSYSKNDNDVSDSENISATANLNFYMAKFFKQKIQATLVFTGRYNESSYDGVSNDDLAFFMQLNISF
ncbi:MAG: hypothetical protein RB296_06995 [Acidobacteriota bacterium]|jgi:hypothetical protein|nr:hypothetical protein [Acidobacteriota bacterium]